MYGQEASFTLRMQCRHKKTSVHVQQQQQRGLHSSASLKINILCKRLRYDWNAKCLTFGAFFFCLFSCDLGRVLSVMQDASKIERFAMIVITTAPRRLIYYLCVLRQADRIPYKTTRRTVKYCATVSGLYVSQINSSPRGACWFLITPA